MHSMDVATPYSVTEVSRLLQESLAPLDWAVARTATAAVHAAPTAAAASFQEGAWSMAMNLAHLAVYDARLANPVLEALLAGKDGRGAVASSGEGGFLRECQALSAQPLEAILASLRVARQQQVRLVEQFSAEQFNRPQTPLWGQRYGAPLHSPGWVATKSWQHTYEHGNAVLRIALFTPLAPAT
jgi:hypothetical protein